jgi:hypothetical protein
MTDQHSTDEPTAEPNDDDLFPVVFREQEDRLVWFVGNQVGHFDAEDIFGTVEIEHLDEVAQVKATPISVEIRTAHRMGNYVHMSIAEVRAFAFAFIAAADAVEKLEAEGEGGS